MRPLFALFAATRTDRDPDTSGLIQRQIDATDRKIDKLAYELYNLTEKEIKIVEDSSR